MSDYTPNLGTKLLPGPSGEAHVIVNEDLIQYDALVCGAVLDRGLTAPPGGELEGDRYIVAPTGATGDWDNLENYVVMYVGGSWKRWLPKVGWTLWVEDEGISVRFDGTSWKALTGAAMLAASKTSDQTLTGSFADVTWNSEQRDNDGVFGHSTSSVPAEITLKDAGAYLVTWSAAIEYVSGTTNPFEAKLVLDGSDVTGSTVFHTITSTLTTATVSYTMVVVASDGDVLKLQARTTAGSTKIKANSASIVVTKI